MSHVNIIKLNATPSTNTYLKDLSKTCFLSDYTVVVCSHQTKGRGQVGAQWYSQPNNSLTLSIFKRFKELHLSQQWYVSMAVSLAVFKTFESLKIPQTRIKWPNDIMSRSKKCCGMLIENTVSGQYIEASIIGIGINVNENQFKDLPLAGSLRLATGNYFDISFVLDLLLQQLKKELTRVENQDFEAIFASYNQKLFKLETVAVYSTKNRPAFNAILKGVSKSGLLILEDENSQLHNFGFKDIRYHI